MLFETVKGVVVKGFITRYMDKNEWETTLIKLPVGSQLPDGDAIPYYLKNPEDGKYYEYYPYYAPEGEHAYVDEENFVEELFEIANSKK